MALGQRKSVRWITSASAVPMIMATTVVTSETCSVVKSVSTTPGDARSIQFLSVQWPSCPGGESRRLPSTNAVTGMSDIRATTIVTRT